MSEEVSRKSRSNTHARRRPPGVMGSVLKTFEVLEAFGREWKPLTIAALSRETGRPKSSLHRILATLIAAGVVEQPAPGEYSLTLKLWRIGISALLELDVLQIAKPHLEELSRAADETVHLAVLEPEGGVVYLTKVESPRSIRVQTQIGKVFNSWCTATGRALLAFNQQAAERVLSQPRERCTPQTVTDAEKLRRILQDIARKGYAVTKAENHPEMGGIAAPIRDHAGATIASCGVAIPIFRMNEELVERCTALVLKATRAISADLGYMETAHARQLKRRALAEG